MKKYYHGLDGLRTIAIISVIFYHLLPNIIRGGFLGVTLFFSISGFLITGPLVKEKIDSNHINILEFYGKRIKRIYPSLIIMLVFVGMIDIFIDHNSNYVSEGISSLLGVNNIWQLSHQVSYFEQFKEINLLKHLWSLSIELQFYLLMPWIVGLLVNKEKKEQRKLKEALVLLSLSSWLILIIVFLFKGNSTAYYLLSARLFSFMLGSLVSLIYKKNQFRLSMTLSCLCLLLMLSSLVFMSDYKSYTYLFGMFFFSLLSAVVIFSVTTQPKIDRLLSPTLFRYIGTRSYDIFLWYFPVITLYQKYMKWDGSNPIIHITTQLIIIILLSGFSFNLSQLIRGNPDNKTFFRLILSVEMLVLFGVIFVILNFLHPLHILSNKKELESAETTLSKEISSSRVENSQDTENTNTIESSREITGEPIASILFIGDSVMLGAEPLLEQTFSDKQIFLQAKVGKQPFEILDDLKSIDYNNFDTVVIGLGNNGLIRTAEFDEALRKLSGKNIIFVTTAVNLPWKAPSNDLLKEYDKNYQNVEVLDWDAVINQPGGENYVDEDGIHLNTEGANKFAALLKEMIDHQRKRL